MAKKDESVLPDRATYLEIMAKGHNFKPKAEREPPPEPIPEPAPAIVASARRGRKPGGDFEKIFFRAVRIGKRVNVVISAEVHAKLTNVLKLVGGDTKLQSYLENILLHHIEQYRDEVNRINRERNFKDVL